MMTDKGYDQRTTLMQKQKTAALSKISTASFKFNINPLN